MIVYHLTDLGPADPTYDQSKAVAVNNAGQAVGSWFPFDGTVISRGFLGHAQLSPIYNAPQPAPIGAIAGRMSRASDINDGGVALGGHWQVESPLSKHDGVFLYHSQGQGNQDITPAIAQAIEIDQIYPHAISKQGVILGSVVTPAGPPMTHFTFDTANEHFTAVPIPIGNTPRDINGNNVIVAGGTTAVYFDGVIHQINGSANGGAHAINENNCVVGTTEEEAFFFDIESQTLTKLETLEGPHTLGGPRSDGLGVNAQGDVVGTSTTPEGYAAFIYRKDTTSLHNLNELLEDKYSGWYLTAATAVNDVGQIAGYGRIGFGKDRAFLLTPVEAPPLLTRTDELAVPIVQILFGPTSGSPGTVITQGGKWTRIFPLGPPVDPLGMFRRLSPAQRDVLVGLAIDVLAARINNQEARRLAQPAGLETIRLAVESLLRSIATHPTSGNE